MNRREINKSLDILNLEALLLTYREEDDETETLAFQVARVPDEGTWCCEGTAEGVPAEFDTVGCDQPAKWTIESESDTGPEMYCSACVWELLGPTGNLKVIAGEVTLDRPTD